MQVTIKIFKDEEEIQSKTFKNGSYKIGRSDSCDLVLDDEKVSRQHLELRVTASAVYFTNLSSSGKVFHNGEVQETGEIASGDQLIIGDFKVLCFRGTTIEPQPSGGHSFEIAKGKGGSQIVAKPEPDGLGVSNDAFAVGGGDLQLENDPNANGGELNADDFGFGKGDDAPQRQSAPPMPQRQAASVATADPFTEGTAALQMNTQLQMKPLVAKLMFTEGPMKGEEFFLETYEITLGRSRKADIFIDDAKLSRIHAKITRMGMGYRLIDLSSRNGTYVNGMRILEHPLNSYDVIGIGKNKIKFLIHDMIANEPTRAQNLAPVPVSDPTKSLQLAPEQQPLELDLPQSASPPDLYRPPVTQPLRGQTPPPPPPRYYNNQFQNQPPLQEKKGSSLLMKLLLVALIAGGVVYLMLPSAETPTTGDVTQTDEPETKIDPGVTTGLPVPPSLPQEYMDLTPEGQRAVESHYMAATRLVEKGAYEDAAFHLQKIHNALPFYKKSQELKEIVDRRLSEKRFKEADENARKDEKQDLVVYLEDGIEYLKVGDFERAAEAFNAAIVIEPDNDIAKKGLKAAQQKVRDIKLVREDEDPELEKRKQVIALFQKAVRAFAKKSYQEAIDTAEQIRSYQLQGDTEYLSEAKQIIDRARMLQKEEFEPFLIQAKEKYVEGDFNASRDLCDEMLKRDPSYEPARELIKKNLKKLNSLAKEAYVTGYILESMGKIDEAKQYWNRARNYVRPGDEYYNKVIKKLDHYQ